MKTIACLLMVLSAAPAGATGRLVCRTAGSKPLELTLVLSHTVVPAIVSVRLREAGRPMPAAIAQAWLDPAELRLDLTDSNSVRRELRLRTLKKGRFYEGSVWRGAHRRWIRCKEG